MCSCTHTGLYTGTLSSSEHSTTDDNGHIILTVFIADFDDSEWIISARGVCREVGYVGVRTPPQLRSSLGFHSM